MPFAIFENTLHHRCWESSKYTSALDWKANSFLSKDMKHYQLHSLETELDISMKWMFRVMLK